MKNKRKAQAQAGGNNKLLKRSPPISVVDDSVLSKIATSAAPRSAAGDHQVPDLSCSVWGLLTKGLQHEELLYRLVLLFLRPAGQCHTICAVDKDAAQNFYLALKQLCKATYFSDKMTKKQVKVNLSSLTSSTAIVTDTVAAAGMIRDSMGPRIKDVICIIHAFRTNEGHSHSGALFRNFPTATHVVLGATTQHLLSYPKRFPMPAGSFCHKASARIALAIKIVSLTSGIQLEPGLTERESPICTSDLSNQIIRLRNKLKVLMSEDIDAPHWDHSKKVIVDSIAKHKDIKVISNADTMIKMAVLGMVPSDIGGREAHGGASSGRTLARSQWMDRASGKSFGGSWSTIRCGASCDDISRRVCGNMNCMKDYFLNRASRMCTSTAACNLKSAATHEEAKGLFPKNVIQTLGLCKVVLFSWKPNPLGDDDTWGGRYGKACGHNEVAMFFARPFAPIEVLNTHLCSRASPAPGNKHYEGCLEFLTQQCCWFKKSMHIWDDSSFHFIDRGGRHSVTPKTNLLQYKLSKLRFLVDQCKWLCINEPDMGDISVMLTYCHLTVRISLCLSTITHGFPESVCNRIGSFLLLGSPSTWRECI